MGNNYLPLFRKYRPQSFDDVIGQDALVKALSNAIELNKIANAYLFCGPRGTGKTSCARIFAKSLNCANGPTIHPCQTCPSCTDITNTSGLDVIEIDAASNRGIQDAKDIIAQVQYAPINGKYKIFIIDEVHMLSTEAFNALLKTFEEPPENVIFILATTEPHKVIETIVSRCQRYDFRRITIDDIVKRLKEISQKENIKITDSALYTIAKNVSGGMRDSLALLDQVSILGIKEEIDKDLIEDILGKINFEVLMNLLKNILNEDIENSIADVNNICSKGSEPKNLAENLMEFLRNVILALSSSDKDNISNFTMLNEDNFKAINELASFKEKVFKILNTLIEYYREIKTSTNPYLWIELAIIACCKLNYSQKENTIKEKRDITAQKIQSAISAQSPINNQIKENGSKPQIQTKEFPNSTTQAQTQTKEIPSPVSQAQTPIKETPKPTVQVPPEVSKNQDGAEIWANVLSAIPSIPTRALYSGTAKLIKVENNLITLGFTHENALNQAKMPSKYAILENTVKNLYPEFSIEMIKVSSDTKYIEVKPKFNNSPLNQQKKLIQTPINNQQQNINEANTGHLATNPVSQEAEDNIKEEKKQYSPKVQEMIEQFNGKIIE